MAGTTSVHGMGFRDLSTHVADIDIVSSSSVEQPSKIGRTFKDDDQKQING